MKTTVLKLAMLLAPAFLYMSCEKDDSPDNGGNDNIERTILVYAVASNSLEGDIVDNKISMLEGLSNVDVNKYRLVVYEVNKKKDHAVLWEAKRDKSGIVAFDSVGVYDRSLFSTDPARISQVIKDVTKKYDSSHYDLFLWSHGTSWLPADTGNRSVQKSFGDDQYKNGQDKTDITELSEAIPSGVFDMIWFDCCLMSSIEVAYQMRDKCDYMVAYPTEIRAEGAPYSRIIPLLMREEPLRAQAAKEVYDFYTYSFPSPKAVTVCVMDMSKIEAVARAAKPILSNKEVPAVTNLLRYSRPYLHLAAELYDFRQYLEEKSKLSGTTQYLDDLKKALDDFVIYKAASEKDFEYRVIPSEHFSGIASYVQQYEESSLEDFYHTLDWWKATSSDLK